MNSFHGTATEIKGRFPALQADIDCKWFEACSMPGRAAYTAVARFEVNRIQLMGHDSAAIFVSRGSGAAHMIVMTVSQQEVFELHIGFQAFSDVSY
jgi:hypothetical protein